MLHIGMKVSYDHVTAVLSVAIEELERNKEKIASPGPKDDPDLLLVSFTFKNLCRLAVKYLFINLG